MGKVGKLGQLLRGVVAALVFSILGTVFHQTVVSGLPLGLVIALFSLFIYSLSIRSLPMQSWAFAIAVSALIFVFSQDVGQDVLIPATTTGFVWSYGAIATALFVAMFPRLRKGD